MMTRVFAFLFLLMSVLACEPMDTSSSTATKPINFEPIPVNYPNTLADTAIVEDYHGMTVTDPYRWLEDDNADATKAWVQAETSVTQNYLEKIPFRESIQRRLEKLWNYERFSTPFKRGGKYYFFKNDGLQNQSILYVQETLDSPISLVLDPNKLSEDGTSSLGGLAFSKDGNYMAYEVSDGGSDWRTIRVMDLKSGKDLDDRIEWVKFSNIAWNNDGFFYSRYPEPTEEEKLSVQSLFQAVYYHKLGTPQSDDEIIFSDRGNPRRGFIASTTEDQRFLAVNVWESTSGNALYFKDLTNDQSVFQPIKDEIVSDFNLIDSDGDYLLILTNYKAPNWRLIKVFTGKPQESYWEEILPESENVLRSVSLAGGRIIANYIQNASSKMIAFDMEGKKIGDIILPGIGTAGNVTGKKSETEAFFSFESFTRPATIYSLNTEQLSIKEFKAPVVDFASDQYETKQVWFESKDGTKIPMFITHKKGLKMDGKRPTMLYGYGGFDISILPGFNTDRLSMAPVIMENDGIFAVANIRGGGEFGKKWHEAGTKEKKQNVFDDFIAAAEYLIDHNYTSSEKLAIYGRSNGGLLVGACMTQRPDLYAVALPAVGVLDMLRYQEFTIGRAWSADYGLSEDAKGFDYLYAYSPLHNIEKKKYPATMITTADHDDRVVPAHSFKFAAALQAHQQGDEPVLIRIESSAGHGAGKPTSKKIEEASDLLSFTFWNMKEKVKYPLDMKD